MAKIGLSSPWVIFYNELNALFEEDDRVQVVYNEEENEVNLYVEDAAEAAALMELLPTEKQFGAVTLKITVIPANVNPLKLLAVEDVTETPSQLYRVALKNNDAVAYITEVKGIFNNPITYVVFKKEVIQYFNDSLGDANGVCSTLMQEIAKDVFVNQTGIYFCTDVANNNFGF